VLLMRLLAAAVVLLVVAAAVTVRADCLTMSPAWQCSDCSCRVGRDAGSRQRAYVNESGRILFGNAPATMMALNTTFVVHRTAGVANPCAPSSLLYVGNVYLQGPNLSDGNCWRSPGGRGWTEVGACAVCY
jgi:hypothetical protein